MNTKTQTYKTQEPRTTIKSISGSSEKLWQVSAFASSPHSRSPVEELHCVKIKAGGRPDQYLDSSVPLWKTQTVSVSYSSLLPMGKQANVQREAKAINKHLDFTILMHVVHVWAGSCVCK